MVLSELWSAVMKNHLTLAFLIIIIIIEHIIISVGMVGICQVINA